jgi:DNA repair exonuclease SbcCD ATPase subunit
MQAVLVILSVAVLLVAVIAQASRAEVKELRDRVEALRQNLQTISDISDEHDANLANNAVALEKRVKELERQMEELPKEDLQARYDAEAAWNEGIRELVGFGKNFQRLNKEGLKNE